MEFIIVLGNSRSHVRELRVNTAVNYYRNNLSPTTIIFSGKGGTIPSEAEVMYDYAVDILGVDPNDCLIENQSQNTQQNFEMSRNLIEESNYNLYNIVVCTSTFHLPRSFTMASFIIGGDIRMIHTDEPVTEQQKNSEMRALFTYLSHLTYENTI